VPVVAAVGDGRAQSRCRCAPSDRAADAVGPPPNPRSVSVFLGSALPSVGAAVGVGGAYCLVSVKSQSPAYRLTWADARCAAGQSRTPESRVTSRKSMIANPSWSSRVVIGRGPLAATSHHWRGRRLLPLPPEPSAAAASAVASRRVLPLPPEPSAAAASAVASRRVLPVPVRGRRLQLHPLWRAVGYSRYDPRTGAHSRNNHREPSPTAATTAASRHLAANHGREPSLTAAIRPLLPPLRPRAVAYGREPSPTAAIAAASRRPEPLRCPEPSPGAAIWLG
jgi:hypothetical protein